MWFDEELAEVLLAEVLPADVLLADVLLVDVLFAEVLPAEVLLAGVLAASGDGACAKISFARLLSGDSGTVANMVPSVSIVPGNVPDRLGGGGGGLRFSVTSRGGADVMMSLSSGPCVSLRCSTVRGASLAGSSSDHGSRMGAR